MAEVGKLDALAEDCNANIKCEVNKAKKKIFFWVLCGVVANIAVWLAHWFLAVPKDVRSEQEAIDIGCGVIVAGWVLTIPISSAISVVLEFRTRLITLSERLDSLETKSHQ